MDPLTLITGPLTSIRDHWTQNPRTVCSHYGVGGRRHMAWSCWGGRSGFERTGPSGEPDTPEYIHVLTCTYEVSTRRGNTQQADDHSVFSLINVEAQGSPHHLQARADHVPTAYLPVPTLMTTPDAMSTYKHLHTQKTL